MTNDQLLTKPIIVLGAPRSGTTLLSQVLRRHPTVHLLDEPRITWKFGNDGKSDVLQPCDARPEVRDFIRQEFAKRIRDAGKTRLVEKTPSNSVRLGFIDAVFPDCKVIHILRDGVQSVLSIHAYWNKHSTGVPTQQLSRRVKEIKLRQIPHYTRELARRLLASRMPGVVGPPMWGVRLPGMDSMVRDLDLLEVCSLQWRWCVESACQTGRQMPADRYMECRLEDIGEPMLKKVLDFCELEHSAEVIDAFHQHFDPSKPSGRSSDASSTEMDQIRRWLEPTLNWLGME